MRRLSIQAKKKLKELHDSYSTDTLAAHLNEPDVENISEKMPCLFKCCRDGDGNVEHYNVQEFIPMSETKNGDQLRYASPATKIPASMLIAENINGRTSSRLLMTLFDSGSDATMINSKRLLRECHRISLSNTVRNRTRLGSSFPSINY